MNKFLFAFSFSLLSGTLSFGQFFIENQGQWPEDFDYKLELSNGAVFINAHSITVHLVDEHDMALRHERMHGHGNGEKTVLHHHAYRIEFLDASETSKARASGKQDFYHNYFSGNDPSRWKSRVGLYKDLYYPSVYPGIDLHFYFSETGYFKYDLVAAPGADLSQVKARYEGLENLRLFNGDLILSTSVGEVTERAPTAFQFSKGQRKRVRCNYLLKDDVLSFEVGKVNENLPLVIDPEVVFSTFTGSTSNNFGFTATYSADGGLYAGSIVFLGTGSYPVTMGAYRITSSGGNIDIALSKFSPKGGKLEYSTYLGGNNDEIPYSLYETRDRALIILGTTGSDNFPTTFNAHSKLLLGGIYASFFNNELEFPLGSDLFVTILDSSGSSLQGSTLFGGLSNDGFNTMMSYNYGDQFRGEVIADSLGNVFVAATTISHDIPTTSSAWMQQKPGKQDGVVFSFNPDLSQLRWATYVGGNENDNAFSLKQGPENKIYVCGGAQSYNMPFGSDSYISSGLGSDDGYIVCLDKSDGSFIRGTYNGTQARDVNYFVEVDVMGDVYVFGQTHGRYPVSGEVYKNDSSSQFIHKFSGNLQTSLKSTVVGDGSYQKCNISPTAFMVDDCRNVYASGWGGIINDNSSNQGYTDNLPVTDNAFQQETDGSDFYFFVLDASWKKLNYGSYFGGPNADHVDGGTSRFSSTGTIYQAVCAGCSNSGGNSDFPTTPGVFSTVNGTAGTQVPGDCNLAAVKIDFQALEVVAKVKADKDSLCIPYTANFNNLSYNADYYIWRKPDGTADTVDLKSYTIDKEGNHSFTLIAIDTTCGFVDSTNITLHGFHDSVYAAFDVEYDSCDNYFLVQCHNLSLDANIYEWDFGDGKTSKLKSPSHGYVNEGRYTIQLKTRNSYCELVDSASAQVSFKKRISSDDFDILYEPCTGGGTDVRFNAYGTGFQKYNWDFGDGNTGTGSLIEHQFSKSGTYYVKLTLEDTLCNRFMTGDTTLVILEDNYSLTFPNIFTPNSDGINDMFGLPKAIPRAYIHGFDMKIYNRWGTLLFSSGDVNKLWDGRYQGESLPDGVYFYLVKIKDDCEKTSEYKGAVHLVKS